MAQRINGTIHQQRAGQLIRNFDQYLTNLKGDPNANYANCAWFDIVDMEEYIASVKQAANNTGKKFSGLRIYFGKYNETLAYDDLTVIMAPTEASNPNALGTPEDSDMTFEAENYGTIGFPPKKNYPHN